MYGGSGSLESLDSDGDGVLSEAEFNAYTGSMASADSNGDGSISESELLKYQSGEKRNNAVTLCDCPVAEQGLEFEYHHQSHTHQHACTSARRSSI